MTKSKFVIEKLTKLFEQGLISYKDLSSEILNVLKSKRDEIVFKMKLTSKEETEILAKRIENLEKQILKVKKKDRKKNYKGNIILTLRPFIKDFSNKILPP